MEKLGDRVKKLRLDMGLTQAQVADILGKSYVNIANVESNRVTNPRYLSALAKTLNTTASFLVDGVTTNKVVVNTPVHMVAVDKEITIDPTKKLYIVEVDKKDKLFLTGSAKTVGKVKKIYR